jgi:membrane associated rhomboid family serine protease
LPQFGTASAAFRKRAFPQHTACRHKPAGPVCFCKRCINVKDRPEPLFEAHNSVRDHSRCGSAIRSSVCAHFSGDSGLMVEQSRDQRILNVPPVVAVLIVLLGLVHALLFLLLTPEQTTEFLLLFAFIPARYDTSLTTDIVWPGGLGADIWTFVTYALIHGGLTHLIFNAVWLLAFGAPVARRFGARRFLLLMAIAAAAGAAVHLATHFGELLPMIGASAAISGAMGAATRFAFQRGGPLALWRDPETAHRVPASPLMSSLRDPRVLAFLLIWFGVNLLFGVGSIGMPGVEQAIAWQAHIGGFLVGLLAFAAFDPIPLAPPASSQEEEDAFPPGDRL